MSDYEIVRRDTFNSSEEALIKKNLKSHNTALVGDSNQKALLIAFKDSSGELMGGLSGYTYWNWLYVDLLWIREDQRKRKVGTQLLALAEEEALRRGCTGAHLTTFSFQALRFYEKHGYTRFGELSDCPPGHSRYYLKKTLA